MAGMTDRADFEQFAAEMLEHLKKLDPAQQKVLRRRFGLTESRQSWTIDEVAQDLGLPREQVIEIERKALEALHAIPTFTEEDFVPGSALFLLRQALLEGDADPIIS